MRMWGIDPKKLCRKHLLGEHLEMHMFAGTIDAGTSIKGYIEKKLVNPKLIKQRHDQLSKEMFERGYKHKSPLLFDCSNLPEHEIDIVANVIDLKNRCKECKL